MVRRLLDDLCHRPVHLIPHNRHGTSSRPTTLHDPNALVGILSALYDQGEWLSAPPCLRHIYSTNPITRLPDFRARAVPNTDADTPDTSYIVA